MDAPGHELEFPRRQDPSDRIRFLPSKAFLVAFELFRLWRRGGKIGAFGVAGLVWTVTPRKLKFVAGGLAAAVLIVLAGSLAALALLALQLS